MVTLSESSALELAELHLRLLRLLPPSRVISPASVPAIVRG